MNTADSRHRPSHIPAGFHSVTPYLVVQDARGLLEFLGHAFGAEIGSLMEDPSGRIVHAEAIIEGSIVEVSEASDSFPARCAALHVFVPDADRSFEQAIAAGAETVYDLMTHDYGERSGGVCDRWGNHWYLATLVDAEKRRPKQ